MAIRQTLKRILCGDDANTIFTYSRRIRKFLFAPHSPELRSLDLSWLQVLASSHSLLPRLDEVRSKSNALSQELMLLMHIMGDSLTKFSFLAPTTSYRSILDALAQKSQGLHSLDLSTVVHWVLTDSENIGDKMCTVLRGAQNLRDLHISAGVRDEVWSAVMQLPRLRALSMSSFRPYTSSPGSESTFIVASLTSLHVRVPTYVVFDDILKACTFPSLESLSATFYFSKPPGHDDMSALVDAIVRSCSPDKLQSLRLLSLSGTNGSERVDYVRPDALRPLCRFSRMRHFQLRTRWYWNLDDTCLLDIARAWPELRELELDPVGFWYRPARVTLSGLVPLAVHCPQLESFGILLGESTAPDTHGTSSCAPNTMLRHLSIGHATIEDHQCTSVATFLSQLFPNLQHVDYPSGSFPHPFHSDGAEAPRTYRERWRRVSDQVASFALQSASTEDCRASIRQ